MSLDSETSTLDLLVWLEKHASPFGLTFVEEQRGLAKHCASCMVHGYWAHGGFEIVSHGIASDKTKALLIAASELIERSTMLSTEAISAYSSNGFAAHSSPILAQRNAIYELFERDAYLCHTLTGTAFLSLDFGKFSSGLSQGVLTFIRKHVGKGLCFQIGQMKTRGPGYGVITAIDGHNFRPSSFGVIIATSYKSNLALAVTSSIHKAFWDLSLQFENEGGVPYIDLAAFLALENPQPQDHGRYALCPDKREWIHTMFNSTPQWASESKESPIALVLKRHPMPSCFSEEPPLHVYSAASDSLQNLFFGVKAEDRINFKRLNQFTGNAHLCERRMKDIQPHFLK
jgi:hypothetical protein